jgi:hypothetical protein
MHRCFQILMSVVFAVHALLGCSAHCACPHNPVLHIVGTLCQTEHDVGKHGEGESHEPCDHDSPDCDCQHVSCSYVKADTVRFVQGGGHVARVTLTPVLVGTSQSSQHFVRDSGQLAAANLSSTPVYVWHCALVI